MSKNVAIYNPGGQEIVGYVSVKHAVKMVYRKVATILHGVPGESFGPYDLPSAVELIKYVYKRWVYSDNGLAPYSRDNVKLREGYRCAYCSGKATTVDHVKPRCQGGLSTWENTVAACEKCNFRKAGRTDKEAGMKLLVTPYVPTKSQLRTNAHKLNIFV